MLAVLNKEKEIKLGLKIHIPIGRPAIMASARVSWVKKVSGHHSRVLIGLRYRGYPGQRFKPDCAGGLCQEPFPPDSLGQVTYSSFRPGRGELE